jgi:glycosyltransferase involved in cell wall biosynthesis
MSPRPIRVLFVVPDLGVGGAERHVTTMLPRMDKARFTSSVICIGDEGELFGDLRASGVEATALHLQKRQALRGLLELTKAMRRTRPDVVVVRGYNAETLGRIAARAAGIKNIVVWVHNFGDVEPRGRVRKAVDRLLARWTTSYFGVAEAQRRYLVTELGYPEDKIRIIHNGVDTASFDVDSDRTVLSEFGIPLDAPVVGTVTALRPEKDHATFLRAARIVVDSLPNARFLIVGDGPMRPQLEQLSSELGITSNVVFAGTRHDVSRLLPAIDVFALSSATVECCPIALLEAMASARPAVCTNVGGVPEIVDHGNSGYLVPPRDPARLAGRVLEVLTDRAKADRMSNAGRERVKAHFDLDGRVAAGERAIEEVVTSAASRRRHILILVENLSVPFDRRVWQESQALVADGHQVTVICPTGQSQDREREAFIEGVRILRYPLQPATGGPRGYLREYSLALWHSLRLAIKVRLAGPVDVVHACNPPDLLFLVALALRPTGARFVFDHHDLVPELFMSRFPGGSAKLHRLTRLTERLTFAAADAVISTNESYRNIAIGRGKMPADRVVVVRSAPDPSRFVRQEPDGSLRRGKRYLLAYLGVMGPQDGVDYALRAIQLLRDKIGRDDVHCIVMGSGDEYEAMVDLRNQLGLADMVEFPGRVPDEFVQRCLSTADICLSPDPLNPLNNLSTMNKVVEYMAMGRPIVSFDLVEARVSAGDAAVYVPGNDEYAFAEAIDILLRDPRRRRKMSETGLRRSSELSWEASRQALIEFYRRLLDRKLEQRCSEVGEHDLRAVH